MRLVGGAKTHSLKKTILRILELVIVTQWNLKGAKTKQFPRTRDDLVRIVSYLELPRIIINKILFFPLATMNPNYWYGLHTTKSSPAEKARDSAGVKNRKAIR